MEKEGKYIYCIIDAKQERNFGPIGIGGRGDEALTIGYDDLSMVVSNHPLNKFVVNRENLLSHERVIENVMKEFDSVLPVRFGTVASNAEEIRNCLDRRYREFKDALRNMDFKIELGVKGIWKNMDVIFNEIVKDNKEINNAKNKIQQDKSISNIQLKREIGKLVEIALQKKKETEALKIIGFLRRTFVDYKLNKTVSDEMFMNAAFLIDKGKEKEFDNIMDDLSEENNDYVKFVYAGPLPAYNFVNINIHTEAWAT